MTSQFNILSHEFLFKLFNGFALGKLPMIVRLRVKTICKQSYKFNSINFLQILKLVLKLEMNSQTCAQRLPLGPKNTGRCWQVVVAPRSFK